MVITNVAVLWLTKNGLYLLRTVSISKWDSNFLHIYISVASVQGFNRRYRSSAQNNHWVARIGATRRGSFRSPHEQLLRVDYISLHPDYVDNGFVNDIAVIRLERAVSFSDYVRPVCLPKAPVLSGTICVVTGWGQLYEIGRVFRK